MNLYLNEAINNFNKYISNVPNAENAGEIKSQIEQLNNQLKTRAEQMNQNSFEGEDENFEEEESFEDENFDENNENSGEEE